MTHAMSAGSLFRLAARARRHPMTSVPKQRLVVVMLTLAMLVGGEISAPRLAAAVASIVFFWWLVGHLERPREASPEPKAR